MKRMGSISSVLALLLLISLVHSCKGNSGQKKVVVFQAGTTKVPYNVADGTKTERTANSFRVPAFVGGMFNNKEFLAVICGAHFYASSHSTSIEGAIRTSYENHDTWTAAESFTNDTKTSATKTLGGDFTAVMKDNKIYMLATRYDKIEDLSYRRSSENGWDPLMFVGTIKESPGSAANGASITWEEGKSLKTELSEELKNLKATQFVGGAGNGVVTKSGAIVFPIYMYQDNQKRTSSILYSKDNGSKWQIGGKTEDLTYDGSVVEWGDNKLLYIVSSDKGYRRVFESVDMGSTWNESLVFSGVWGDTPQRTANGNQGSAIKVSVDNKNVLLFAHPLTSKGGSSADTLQLWLSDGQRIVRIGTISEEDKEHHSGNAILAHFNDHLYITHEINPISVFGASDDVKKWEKVIGFSPLPQFFESAKTTARAWKNLDAQYKTKGIPTDGLVGVLESANTENSVWTDMYNCVNATVNNGKSVSGGFQFNGEAESGAQWPVASQGQNQVYIFADKQFTLAATIIIHTAKDNGQFSVIGASLDSVGKNILFGLGYTHDNKWFTVSNDEKEIKKEKLFMRDKEYHVAIIFLNGVASVYVDGIEIAKKTLEMKKPSTISHFYMGGMGQLSSSEKGSLCTVKNVMLFNRNLKENEIAKLTEVGKEDKREEQTSTTLPKVKPNDIKSVSTTESNKLSLPSKQKKTNGETDDKKKSKSQQELLDGVEKKETKNDNGSVVSLCVVGWMSLVCSFIALMGL